MLKSNSVVIAVFLVCSVCHCMGKPDEDHPRPSPCIEMIAGKVPKETIDVCLKEVGMTEEEFEARAENPSGQPNEKRLCMGKCIGLSVGAIKKDGSLDINFIKGNLPTKIKEDATVISCLQNVGTISTCQDMKKIRECAPKRENN
nr:odorant binding protein 3 [Pagiophloeus tsushimanus]